MTQYQLFFTRLKNSWKERHPRGLLASLSLRSFVQKNSFASSARQTSFVFYLNSLTSFQAKRARVGGGQTSRVKLWGENLEGGPFGMLSVTKEKVKS